MALWKAREGKFIKNEILDQQFKIMALWKAKGESVNKESEFRLWYCGRQAGRNLNKKLDFALWHCGRQGGEV